MPQKDAAFILKTYSTKSVESEEIQDIEEFCIMR